MPPKYKYTKELLAAAAAEPLSIADVLRRLGIKWTGGSHVHVSRRLKHFGIDTSHFLGHAHLRGQPSPQRRRPEQILTVWPAGGPRPNPRQLRRALEAVGVPQTCAACKIGGAWQGRPLTLHVDHMNGDWLDNRRKNLRFLCLIAIHRRRTSRERTEGS